MRFFLTLIGMSMLLFCNAQQQNIDEIFGSRSEIYFRFSESQITPGTSFQGGISIDKRENGFVYAYASKPQFESFLSLGYSYEKLTAPSLLLPESELNMLDNVTLGTKSTLAWDYYPTYTAYVSLMQQFASSYPNICQLDTIGTTVEGRLLLVVKISDNVSTDESEPEFFYTSTMHGDECTGYVLMLHLIDYLLTNYGSVTRITNLVNNMEIFINPNGNPDGTYAGGNTTVSGATRYNANGEDLNRNYPVPDGTAGDDGTYTQQVETQAFVAYIEGRHFVMSANLHGGIELMNYPWDYTSNDHADKTWWMYVSKEYADTAQANSPAGYFDAQPSMYVGSPDYPGVVEGYSWYPAPGSRQDYSQYFAQCREVTIEVSDTKTPSASTLESHWNYNYKSLLNYIEQAQYGIRGTITDNCTGMPVKAMITITSHDADSSMVFSDDVHGTYYRPIAPGTWNMSVSAPGYQTATTSGVTTVNKTFVTRNFSLNPTAPTVDFSADVTSTCSGIISFVNESTFPQGSTFLWNFGDGQTSTLENPTHTYSSNGNYTVKLKIMTCAGNDSLTRTSYISVNMPVAPSTVGDEICGSGTLTLTASGSGTIQWYDAPSGGNIVGTGSPWTTPVLFDTTYYYASNQIVTSGAAQHAGMTDNSGGGQYFTSTNSYRYMIFDVLTPITLESVKVYVNSAGNRTIYLQSNTGVTLDSVVVNIPTGQNPYLVTLNFDIPIGTSYRLGVKTGSTNNLYIASGPSYPYTITDVISITGNNQNQSYYYFFFDWIVKTSETCESPRTIVEAIVNPAPLASFNYVDAGNTIDFQNTSSNGSSYYWDFDDGQTSTQTNPSHTYATSGTYTVTLIVTGIGGCSDTISQNITLGMAPAADFSADTVCVGTSTHFTDLSNPAFGTLVSWNWNFGDGTYAATQNPTHTFSASGTYNVTLIVENNSLLSDTITLTIVVADRPLAAFTSVPGLVDEPTYFTDASNSPFKPVTSWSWNFGDLNTSNLQNPEHIYTSPGSFGVILIASNECGSDTASQTIQIILSAIAEQSSKFLVFPNPVYDNIVNIQFFAAESHCITISLTDEKGSIITSMRVEAVSGNNLLPVSVQNLSKGLYFIQIDNQSEMLSIPFMRE